MSDISVTERRLRPILDAVAIKNWKQALQQCDKWQKKGERSDRFLALKASILVNQPDKSHIEKGKLETLQLCHRKPPVTDIEALYQLQESLRHLSLHHEEGPKLWERAIAARPDDKDLLTTLLHGSVTESNWTSAQKAAMALRKAFPNDRQYDYWNMLLCYLIHRDISLPQKDRDLFGRLAYMLMSKAAESVSTTKNEPTTAGKAISTPEELSLLVKIYGSTGHVDQALKALRGDALGLKSQVAGLDPQFIFSLLLEVLSLSEDRDEAFTICKDLVVSGSAVSPEHREDDRVWKILQDIGKRAEHLRSDCIQLAQSVYQSEPKCRAAYLAYFDLATHDPTLDEKGRGDLVSACVAFYKTFDRKPHCYGDISRALLHDKSVLESFLSQMISRTGDVIQQTFALKLRYNRLDTREAPVREAEYLELAVDAIRLHKQLPQEKSECPEILLLAATVLLQLSLRTRNGDYLLQASYLLHNCYTRFNEYYPVAIRQIQLCLVQCQVKAALEKFTALAVKNMQWETVGHLILTRISTLCPFQSSNATNSMTPLSALDAGLTMFDSADRSLDKAILEGLKYGSYSNIIDSVDVKSSIARSINRQIFVVEERRIQRIVGVPHDVSLDPYPAEMVDQRDFSFLPNFSNDKEVADQLEKFLACGPLPKKRWVIAAALQDHLATHLKAELAAQKPLAATTFDRLKTTLEKTKQINPEYESQLTEDEIQSLICHQLLSEALLLAKEPLTSKQLDFDTLITNLESWLDAVTHESTTAATTTTINGVQSPTWKFLHKSFTQLDNLQTISNFLTLQARCVKTSKSSKAITITKDKLSVLQQAIIDGEKAVHARAKKLKDGINASGVLGRLVDAATGRIEVGEFAEIDQYKLLAKEIRGLVDEAGMEEYCGNVKEGWEDALESVLRMRVKSAK